MKLLVRIHGTRLPGLQFEGYGDVFVGLQRRAEPDQLAPGNSDTVQFSAEVEVVAGDTAVDFRGPYVHGRRGARFIYLTWGAHPDADTFVMFRRAKLELNAIPVEVLSLAMQRGVLEASLGLTDALGGPLCAAVRPPTIAWSVPAVAV